MTTIDRIRTLLVKDYKLDPDKLTDDARLEDLGVDSLGMAELVFNIEDEFGLTVPDVATTLTTFGEVVRFIDDLIAARDAQAGSSMTMTENPQPTP
ncbi:MAG: acyl carrier protein [Rhodoferax sp.]|uniref:phosphopantetheine-binding protein n=1 Tax=Rhodoferax sp. TaxID=50421 RepID=UPI00140116A4|nr:phosphopantetheine-binding protein [Rhodoferax sp.]NDP40441.1 acyl carrier protein [Rhodoferax sp.]